MANQPSICYFLGANTARGFFSLYDELADPLAGDRVWYIKGGPGNGKSTFMRHVAASAEGAGKTVEYFPCSGDPDSLDGIYIRDDKTAYVDATSPHVQEPVLPGAAGRYLDLSGFYKNGLAARSAEIHRLYGLYREQYRRSYNLLHAAELASPERTPELLGKDLSDRISEAALSAAEKMIAAESGGRVRRRFLSALTCQGRVTFWETAASLGRICTVESALGLGDHFLKHVAEYGGKFGCSMILCLDPISPDRLEAVVFPEQRIVFISVRRRESIPVPVWKRFRLDPKADPERIRRTKQSYRSCEMLCAALLREAQNALERAKAYHDELEKIYYPYVDFQGIDRLCRKHMEKHGK